MGSAQIFRERSLADTTRLRKHPNPSGVGRPAAPQLPKLMRFSGHRPGRRTARSTRPRAVPGRLRSGRCYEIATVPDRFPTMEVAAALGVVVLTLRVWVLEHTVSRIARLNDRLVELLDGGEPERALALCETLEAPVYPQIARRVLRAAERASARDDDEALRAKLSRAFHSSHATQVHRVHSGIAGDLVVLAVLLGAVVYVYRAGMDVSLAFFALAATGGLLLAYGAVSRRRVLAATARSFETLLPAVERAARRSPSRSGRSRCPVCGGPRQAAQRSEEELGSDLSGPAAGGSLERITLERLCQ